MCPGRLFVAFDKNKALSVSSGDVKCSANSPQIHDAAYKTSHAVEFCELVPMEKNTF